MNSQFDECSKSTGAIIDNPADPGTPSCQTGIVVLRRSGVSGSFEERDYIDLGARTALSSDGVTTLRDSGTISQVKIGVNYRFTPGDAVVAKY